jgi:hypothetical protein
MPFDPTILDYANAIKMLPVQDDLEKAAFVFLESEDYFQSGKQYIGPQAATGDTEGKKYIEQSFVALAKLGELARRYVSGAVGQEPSFETVDDVVVAVGIPAPNEVEPKASEAKSAADMALGAWWDAEKMAETTELFTARLCSMLSAYFHYGVPPGLVRDVEGTDGAIQSAIQADGFEDALNLIYCESPKPGTATIYTDPETREKYGMYSYSEQKKVGTETKTINCLEISWCPRRDETGAKVPDENLLTRVLILKSDDSAPQQFALETGGVPLVVGATFHPLVFAALASKCNISLNNAINAVSTMVKINADVAGFPEKNHLDIDPPVINTGRIDEETGVTIYEDVEVVTGPRTAPFHMSVVDESNNEQGRVVKSARSGTIIYRAPVSSEPLLEVIRFYMRALYESANQAHVLELLSPDSSGVARVEARADFARALLKIARKVEGSLREVFRGVRCLAAYVGNDARLEQFKSLRDNVTCHPNSGPLTPDEKRLILEMVAAEVISRELAMVMMGVEDVEAEMQKIQNERNLRDFGEPVLPDGQEVARGTEESNGESGAAETT